MGQQQSKKSVKQIENEVNDLRRSIRQSKGKINNEKRQELQKTLVNFSKDIDKARPKSKRKSVEHVQRLISETTTELLLDNEELDAGSVETNSFIHQSYPPKSKSSSSLDSIGNTKSAKSSKSNKTRQSSLETLENIDRKITSMKQETKVAISNNDTNRLNFLKKSIETLATSLELIPVSEYENLSNRKKDLEKNLKSLYRKIDTAKRQLEREDNIQYLTEYEDKEKTKKYLKNLEEIEESLQNFEVNKEKLNEQNQLLQEYKSKVQSIEDVSPTVQKKKIEVFETILKYVSEVNTIIQELQIVTEEKMRQAEESLKRCNDDLSRFDKSNKSEDFEKYKTYLFKLRDYVANLSEVNDNIVKRKQQFMIDIVEALAMLQEKSMECEEPKTSTKPEEKITIRQKQKIIKTNKTIDGFYSYWMELQEAILHQGHEADELGSICSLLKTIKDSIDYKIREIQQVHQTDSPDLVKVKITDTAKINTLDNIKQIQNELKLLNRKIETSTFEQDDPEYINIRNTLQSYKEKLVKMSNSDSIRNLSKTINNILEKLEHKIWTPHSTENKRVSTETVLEDIMEISTRVNNLGSRLQSGTMTESEQKSIKDNLLKYQKYLNEMDLKKYSTSIKHTKDEVQQDITQYLAFFDSSSTDNTEVKNLKEEVKKLKEKVNRFSGAYKNILYRKLEDDLNGCLLKIVTIPNENEKNNIQNEIDHTLKVLEEKAIKDNEYNSTLEFKKTQHEIESNIRLKLEKIQEDVDNVIEELNDTHQKTKDELLTLDGRLALSILALDNLTVVKDKNIMEDRDKLYDEIQKYISYINDQIAISEQALPVQEEPEEEVTLRVKPRPINVEEELSKLEMRVENVKIEIANFVGDENSPKFSELDDALIETTLKLDTFKLEKGSELSNRKLKLLKELQKACEMLDRKVEDTTELNQLEKEVQDAIFRIDSFNGAYGDKDYNELDELLINLSVKARKMVVNDELKNRKQNCIKNIENSFKKLNQMVKDRTAEGIGEGTLV